MLKFQHGSVVWVKSFQKRTTRTEQILKKAVPWTILRFIIFVCPASGDFTMKVSSKPYSHVSELILRNTALGFRKAETAFALRGSTISHCASSLPDCLGRWPRLLPLPATVPGSQEWRNAGVRGTSSFRIRWRGWRVSALLGSPPQSSLILTSPLRTCHALSPWGNRP